MTTNMPFSFIKTKEFTVTRTAKGSNDRGVYVKGAQTSVPVQALVYPFEKKDMMDILPEALRKRKMVRIFTNTTLYEHQLSASYEADEIQYGGESYRVWKLANWNDVNSFFATQAYGLRVDAKELTSLIP